MNLSSLQNPLIQPSVGPDLGDTVTTALADGLGEIVAEDTNNIVVQVRYAEFMTTQTCDIVNVNTVTPQNTTEAVSIFIQQFLIIGSL